MRAYSILALLCSIAFPALAATPPHFVQDRFAIGFWVGPPMDNQAEARYAELAEANFTLALGGFGANTPEGVARELQLCEKYDLKVLVARQGLPADQLPDSPACWGYLVRDEPSAVDFPDLRLQVDDIRAHRPGKLAYINLFPTYARPQQLGTDSYDEHVRRFVEEVRPEVLSFDHYPKMTPSEDGRQGYCDNLAIFRKHALRAGIPFWNFFNIMPFGPHFDPTEAQVRWQIFASLAYGAKGVLYFCYFTPGGDEFPKGGAIINQDGSRTRHYDQAKRINAVLKNLGPVLMELTSTEVRRISPGNNIPELLNGTPITQISDGDYLLGLFTHADGRRALLLVNYDMAYTAWPTLEFDTDPAQVLEVSPANGQSLPVLDDSPQMPGLQLSFDAGEGRLFLLPAK